MELDTIYVILAIQAIGMLVTTAVYYAMRLKIETQKAESARKSFESMVRYHSARLDLEQEKLDLARRNGGQKLSPKEWESATLPLEQTTWKDGGQK